MVGFLRRHQSRSKVIEITLIFIIIIIEFEKFFLVTYPQTPFRVSIVLTPLSQVVPLLILLALIDVITYISRQRRRVRKKRRLWKNNYSALAATKSVAEMFL
jgi:hypothetical protein